MRVFLKIRVVLMSLVVLLLGITLIAPLLAQETMSETFQVTTAQVNTHPSQGDVRPVDDAMATIMTNEAGASLSLHTNDLIDGHVYSIWWIVVNNPEACEVNPCAVSDVLGNSDAVQSDITQADSIIMDEEAHMSFASYLPAGDIADGWLGNGFTNPLGAEIHIAINDHGPVIPDMAANMLSTYRGGCTDESLPPPYPDTARADGEPGPNTCRLVQFAILVQGS